MNRILLTLLLFPVVAVAQTARPSSLGWSDAWLDFPVSLARHNHSALTTNRPQVQFDMRPIGTVVTNLAGTWCYYTSGNPTNSHLRLFETPQDVYATVCLECEADHYQGLSWTAWFWMDGSEAIARTIFSSWIYSFASGWRVLLTSSNALYGEVDGWYCNARVGVTNPVVVSPYQWNHVAMVRTAGTGYLKLYFNGLHTETSTNTCPYAVPYSALRGLQLGATRWESVNQWLMGLRGCVTGFRYYRRELSDNEIMTIYSEGPP